MMKTQEHDVFCVWQQKKIKITIVNNDNNDEIVFLNS